MANPLEDDRLLALFRVLRIHVVRVSAKFGAKLGVRLRAIRAAEDYADPTVVDVLGRTFVEATNVVVSPLLGTGESREDKEDDDE